MIFSIQAFEVLVEFEAALGSTGTVIRPPPQKLPCHMEVRVRNSKGVAFELPLLRFKHLGTKQGQKAFFASLRKRDAAFDQLCELGWPKRQAFSFTSYLAK